MLKRCVPFVGLGLFTNRESSRKKELEGASDERESRRKKELGGASISLDVSLQSKDIYVRTVHAGGREELYQYAIPASQLMAKYPGMSVVRPEVFRSPHESLLCPEENLLPGQKYYVVPSTTIQKLKDKHPKKAKVKEPVEVEDETWDWKITIDAGQASMEDRICCAKEFYASKERWSKCSSNKFIRGKKPFIPPLPKAKSVRGLGWEPSLTSVPELSP